MHPKGPFLGTFPWLSAQPAIGWRLCAVAGLTCSGLISFNGAACSQQAGSQQTGSQQPGKVSVLELYTSQGCKSCPPADDNFARYADDPHVLALSFHVNYWDYMGWRDTLATQDNVDRQNAYRNAFKAKMVYTPQAVIDGRVEVNGRDADLLQKTVAAGGMTVPVSIRRMADGRRLSIEIGAGEKPKDPVHVTVLYFRDSVTVPITRGEIAGKTVTYRNAVSDIDTIGMWDGKALQIDLPASQIERYNASGCAVLLQTSHNAGHALGPILGAAVYKQTPARL